jgi:hypothetical protein
LLKLGFDPTVAFGEVLPGRSQTVTFACMIMSVYHRADLLKELLDFPFDDDRLIRIRKLVQRMINWGHPLKGEGQQLLQFLKERGFTRREDE